MFGFLKTLLGQAPAPKKAVARATVPAQRPMTPDRAALIKNAMAVHRAKQSILADLSDEQRSKLLAVALQKMLRQGREPGEGA